MHINMKILVILAVVIAVNTLNTKEEWNGDPLICELDLNPDPTPPGIQYPTFPDKAEFTLVETAHAISFNLSQFRQVMFQYFYDYSANKMIKVTNFNGIITLEYFYYNSLKTAIYSSNQFCTVKDIPVNLPSDSSSAIMIDNVYHIRPLEQFLAFTITSLNGTLIKPKYIGEDKIRGIPVDTWRTCVIDKTTYRTTKYDWSFAKPNFNMPGGQIRTSYPVQGRSRTSIMVNGSHIAEVDAVLNVFSYKPGIVEQADYFTPPKGVLCHGLVKDEDLVSLEDQGIQWPNLFSVRIGASTSKQMLWRNFHLRYNAQRKILRYDYKPIGNNLQEVVIDHETQHKYTIDRTTGACQITKNLEYDNVDVLKNPIEFFFKFQNYFLNSPKNAFQFVGIRNCRNSIQCIIFAISEGQFPPDTSESWIKTNLEWAWSKRESNSISPTGKYLFDYPVHLYLKLYRKTDDDQPVVENIQYEFYEFNQDVHENEFDVSVCYRSNDLLYKHVAFQLKMNRPISSTLEDVHLDRRVLLNNMVNQLTSTMDISRQRVSNLEIDHNKQNDTLYCIFTILDRPPLNNPADAISVLDARDRLKQGIDGGLFKFEISDGLGDTFIVSAIEGTLEDLKHLYLFDSNVQINNITVFINTTININNTVIVYKEEIREKTVLYQKGSQPGAIVGGLAVGLVFGILTLLIIYQIIIRRQSAGKEGGSGFPNISYRGKKTEEPTLTMDVPISSDA